MATLKFLNDGLLLASGSNDTDFIVWDIVAESGLVRLHGHTGPITDIAELPRHGLLLTSSRDHHIRVWDPEAQHCVQVRVLLCYQAPTMLEVRHGISFVSIASR